MPRRNYGNRSAKLVIAALKSARRGRIAKAKTFIMAAVEDDEDLEEMLDELAELAEEVDLDDIDSLESEDDDLGEVEEELEDEDLDALVDDVEYEEASLRKEVGHLVQRANKYQSKRRRLRASLDEALDYDPDEDDGYDDLIESASARRRRLLSRRR